MKRLLLSFILCALILASIAFSTLMEVNINEEVKNKFIFNNETISNNVVKFSMELYNIGSVAYNDRIRIFIYNNDSLLFNGWSQEKKLMSGDKKAFDIYWVTNSPGIYKYKLRSYFGNEIAESEEKEFEIKETLDYEDVFEINNFRTYDNKVIFDVKSKKDVKNVIIIPYSYVSGWIFEQKSIESIRKDVIKPVSIDYYPSVWIPSTLKLAIVAENGKYYSEKTVEMKKEEGILKMFNNLLDSLKLLVL